MKRKAPGSLKVADLINLAEQRAKRGSPAQRARHEREAARLQAILDQRRRQPSRRIELSQDKAVELFVGGLCSCLTLADRLELSASCGGALMSALSMALPDLTRTQLGIKGIVEVYHKIGGELPFEVGGELLAATARKRKRKTRVKRHGRKKPSG